ncbi:hypothetical protein [Halomonas koreensis]|uniref:Uncharacterized protein n=1 Tax=Halomonas koreensis TaxID=245385 RepID=A0ABU1G4U8_9GAMM|nr:hypothetical protein [Halomonas koreensis]MDR5867930.1 hypothetical protein [Halomonas koreensis]
MSTKPNAAPEHDQEFEDAQADAYFDEFAGDGPVSPEDPQAEARGDDAPADDLDGGQPRDDNGRFARDDDAPGDGGDAPQGGGDPAPQEGDEDPQAELDRLRQEAQTWQHRYQSDLGRQNALQRKIQELQEENRKLQESGQPAAGQGGQGQDQGSDNPQGSGYSNEEWDQLKADFPEIARGIEQQIGAMQKQYESQIEQLKGQLTPIQQQAEQQAFNSEIAALEQQHPDWRETVNRPEFHSWLQQQPPRVQEMFSSDSAADAAYLLGTFKTSTGAAQEQPNQNLRQRRQRTLENARTVPSRGGRQRSAIPDDDEDALFNYFADKD